jgi:hypothetical protein
MSEGATRSSRVVTRVSVWAVCLVAISWIFFQYPTAVLYNRYFEAATIFNPTFTVACNLEGWSYCFHAGYQTFSEILYISPVAFAMVAAHAVMGTAALSHLYPAFIQIATFVLMFLYLKRKVPGAGFPVSIVAALFYTENPFLMGMIHEGYSGVLIDYAMLPASLLLVDFAATTKRDYLLLLVPLLYTATGMYRLPIVIFSFAAIAVLEWKRLRPMIAGSRMLQVGMIFALLVNLYWALPMIAYVHFSSFAPVQADTSNEINTADLYGSLTNVTMMTAFAAFGRDTGVCSACGYFTHAWPLMSIAILVIGAMTGLIRRRAYRVLGLTLLGIVLATGNRYTNDLIGIPYKILEALTNLGLFRDPSKAMILVLFGYAYGVAELGAAFKGRPAAYRNIVAVGALAVVVAALPLFTGSIMGHDPASLEGNYFVHVPTEYTQMKAYLSKQFDPRAITLLEPADPSVTYDWGARVNDFLPAYLGRPTLSATYWPQPNPYVQLALDELQDPLVSAYRYRAILSALRVNAVLIHDDVAGKAPVPWHLFGNYLRRFGPRYGVVKTTIGPAPALVASRTAAILPVGQDAEVYSVYERTITDSPFLETSSETHSVLACDRLNVGSSDFDLSRNGRLLGLSFSYRCGHRVSISALGVPGTSGQFVLGRDDGRIRGLPTTVSSKGGLRTFSSSASIPPGWHVGFLLAKKRGEILALTVSPSIGTRAAPQAVRASWQLDGTYADLVIPKGDRYLVLNQSFSGSWAAYAIDRGWKSLPKFLANGYANGWGTGGARRVLLISWAQGVFVVAMALSGICLIIVLAIFVLMRKITARPRPVPVGVEKC